jgi:hypothetical protein
LTVKYEARANHNYRNTVAGMTDEAKDNHNYRHTVAGMTDEARYNHNYRNTAAGMSENRINRRNERNAERRKSSRFKEVAQYWNYEQPCIHCHCIHLRSASLTQKKYCCQNGNFLINPNYPKLFELPVYLKNLMLQRTEHLSSRSSYYNNIFSIAVTGYDNGRDGVGAERRNGPSALTINGRVYHFFPNSVNQKYGGIANFTYDGCFQVQSHADMLNNNLPDSIVQRKFVKGNRL